MAAYIVVDTDWQDTDIETRAAYGRAAQPAISSYGGRFLTPPGSTAEPLEGDWDPKILTILEFPDVEQGPAVVGVPRVPPSHRHPPGDQCGVQVRPRGRRPGVTPSDAGPDRSAVHPASSCGRREPGEAGPPRGTAASAAAPDERVAVGVPGGRRTPHRPPMRPAGVRGGDSPALHQKSG